jgi:hypothetical protein
MEELSLLLLTKTFLFTGRDARNAAAKRVDDLGKGCRLVIFEPDNIYNDIRSPYVLARLTSCAIWH